MPNRKPCILNVALLLCCILLGSGRAVAQLYDERPYDQITLDKLNDNTVLKVEPLDPANLQRQAWTKPGAKLSVKLIGEPDKTYAIQCSAIVKLEPFAQLVLNRANQFTAGGDRDEAYDYFRFLAANYPKLPGLDAAIENYLYEEAKTRHRNKQYDGALAILRELHDRNPKRSGLENALTVPTEKLIERYVADDDYPSVRALIDNLAACFPEAPLVGQWRGKLRDLAAGLLTEAKSAARAGNFRDASRAIRRVEQIWPTLSGAEEVARSIHEKYTRVVIGTSSVATSNSPGQTDRMLDWAFRRTSRLTTRTITEFVGPAVEGREYRFPAGRMEIEKLGRRLVFQVEPDLRASADDTGANETALTGYLLARRLLAMADPDDAAYRRQWGELLEALAVREVYWLEADLRRPHVRPGALLVSPLCDGPYAVDSKTENESVYVTNQAYFAATPTQPKEIVERLMPRGSRAIAALKRGRVDVIDRVNPWDLEKLRSSESIVLEPYAAPLLHCLIPNLRRPLMAKRAFRRALVYGIHRQVILSHLTGGAKMPGSQVVSGPFLAGRSFEDPLGYAYDASIKPRPYRPRLAVALAGVALGELHAKKDKASKAAEKPPVAMPTLLLAHPPHEIARVACTMIARQLGLAGIPVELKELNGCPIRLPDDVDLLYAELAVWEPLVDARRLLDLDGISGGASPYMSLALAQLQQASDWKRVRRGLRKIHRIAHDDVAVVPLWQLTDHFAYRSGLTEAAEKPVSLYQDVERWQPAFRYNVEAP